MSHYYLLNKNKLESKFGLLANKYQDALATTKDQPIKFYDGYVSIKTKKKRTKETCVTLIASKYHLLLAMPW